MKRPLLICLVLSGMFAATFFAAPDACIDVGDSELCDHRIRVLIFAVLGAQMIASGLVIRLSYRGQQH